MRNAIRAEDAFYGSMRDIKLFKDLILWRVSGVEITVYTL